MNFDFSAIDAFLKRLELARDDDELRRLFDSYSADFDLAVPSDPFSAEYRAHQFALYERLHGKAYSTTHETSAFDVDAMAISPFPYVHGSATLVGDQLMGIGFLVKTMALPKGARILEFGPGWGNTTLALAKMGYEVLAIDVEQNFVDLIRQRAQMERITKLEVQRGDFFTIESLPAGHFDAVLFFECFHHCDDHLRLMASFDRVVKPRGIVCLAAEPIIDHFPLPWGLRMDGQSLWAIRRNGWLELGFHTDYFRSAMARFGWMIERRTGRDGSLSSVILAKRRGESSEHWDFAGTELRNQVGTRHAEGVTTDGRAGYLMFGPYVPRSAGRHVACVDLGPESNRNGTTILEVVSNTGQQFHSRTSAKLGAKESTLRCAFELPSDVQDLEVRVHVDSRTQCSLLGLTLSHDT
jgi:ubiquinone/menaquinone biosynthesis C-methylase UbiE